MIGLHRKRQRSSQFFLEQKDLASSTINVRLAAVRRLAYEAFDAQPSESGDFPQRRRVHP
jgi:hypothetical protein